MRQSPSFFRGSELPRLLVLSGIMVAGWVIAWQYAGKAPEPIEPPVVVDGKPVPIVPDRSIEFESVTDRTAMGLRDNAAYSLLLERARGKGPAEMARESRRDILLTHLWERPQNYRGVPVHVEGTALRVLRYESKLSKTGWLYEAWVNVPDVRRVPYVCVFEDPPRGLPIGSNVSEKIAFDGYFLKIMKYEAGDVSRGAPVLVGRIALPRASVAGSGSGSTLRWMLILLGAMIFISLVRWVMQLIRFFEHRGTATTIGPSPSEEIDPAALDHWVRKVADEEADRHWDEDEPAPRSHREDEWEPNTDEPGAGASPLVTAPEVPAAAGSPLRPANSGTRPPDEAQSTSLPATGD